MNWEDAILGAIRERNEYKRKGAGHPSVFTERPVRTHIHMTRGYIKWLNEACRKRNVNRSTYIRRSIGMMLAHDLGLSIRTVLSQSQAWGAYGQGQSDPGKADNALGIETWCPHPGCHGEHLR